MWPGYERQKRFKRKVRGRLVRVFEFALKKPAGEDTRAPDFTNRKSANPHGQRQALT
jgi:hypothetical protein